jgi:hypothetical protein
MHLSRLDRLDILQIARDQFGFHGDGGCCGAAALAINEVLFGNEAEIVMALNQSILDDDEDFVGHVGVLDKEGVIWDFRMVYVGAEGIEDFRAWGMVGPDDPSYDLTEEEAENAEIYLFDSLDEAREAIGKTTRCPCGTELADVLRTATAYHFRGTS